MKINLATSCENKEQTFEINKNCINCEKSSAPLLDMEDLYKKEGDICSNALYTRKNVIIIKKKSRRDKLNFH